MGKFAEFRGVYSFNEVRSAGAENGGEGGSDLLPLFRHTRVVFWLGLIFAACLILAPAVYAAEPAGRLTKKVPVEAIDTVNISGASELIIVQADTPSLEVTAPEAMFEHINVKQKGATLYLGRKDKKRFGSWFNFTGDDDHVRFVLSVKTLAALHVTGAARVKMDYLTGKQLRIDLSGASKLRLGEVNMTSMIFHSAGASNSTIESLQVDAVKIGVVGASQLTINGGSAMDLAVEAVGASKVRAAQFKAATAKASAVGASKIELFAAESIDAKAAGASYIGYKGEPKDVEVQQSGASNINAL